MQSLLFKSEKKRTPLKFDADRPPKASAVHPTTTTLRKIKIPRSTFAHRTALLAELGQIRRRTAKVRTAIVVDLLCALFLCAEQQSA